jgi:hypothetical protein
MKKAVPDVRECRTMLIPEGWIGNGGVMAPDLNHPQSLPAPINFSHSGS